MSTPADIARAVSDLRRDCGIAVDPAESGPVQLNRIFAETRLSHVSIPDLTRGKVVDHLRRSGVPVEDVGEPGEPLDGFVFTAGRFGWAFVCENDRNILPRRRFTAAHELGHFVLHRDRMGRFRADVKVYDDADDGDELEREANRFAAELLMPAEVCVARAKELSDRYGRCPRGVLAYRLSSELLVSRAAMRYRLKSLGVGDDD